jgi:NADH-quinone oxidoreductase subunit A
MYPWAVVYKQFVSMPGPFFERTEIFWSMLSFVFVLTVGYVYAIKKGVLDWKK